MAKNLYTIFLNGAYESSGDEYYRRLIERSTSIAVDGGAGLFERLHLVPNILLGDFDSGPEAPDKFSGKSEIINYPAEKDRSDGEIAIALAAQRGADEILVCGYVGGSETDHQLGNLLLLAGTANLAGPGGTPIKATAVRPGERIWYIQDNTLELVGSAGDMISVLPLDPQITLTLTGLKYDANLLIVPRGSTRSLRNTLTGRGARITVLGAALVFHRRPASDGA